MSAFDSLLPSGFLVVPLSEVMVQREGFGRPVYELLQTVNSSIAYGGVDRRGYSDLDEWEYEPGLPEEIATLWKSLHFTAGVIGLDVCHSIDDARTLLAYCNQGGETHELIAVRAPLLVNRIGTLPIVGYSVEWLGFDVLAYGEWSLLNDGLFKRPDVFAAFVPDINPHGLFSAPEVAPAFTAAYVAATQVANIEPFHPPMLYDEHAGEFGTAYTVEVGGVHLS